MYAAYIHLQLLSPNHISLNLLRKLLTFLCCLCRHRKMQLKMSLTSVVWTLDIHLPSIFPQFFFHLNMKYNSATLRVNVFFIQISCKRKILRIFYEVPSLKCKWNWTDCKKLSWNIDKYFSCTMLKLIQWSRIN